MYAIDSILHLIDIIMSEHTYMGNVLDNVQIQAIEKNLLDLYQSKHMYALVDKGVRSTYLVAIFKSHTAALNHMMRTSTNFSIDSYDDQLEFMRQNGQPLLSFTDYYQSVMEGYEIWTLDLDSSKPIYIKLNDVYDSIEPSHFSNSPSTWEKSYLLDDEDELNPSLPKLFNNDNKDELTS